MNDKTECINLSEFNKWCCGEFEMFGCLDNISEDAKKEMEVLLEVDGSARVLQSLVIDPQNIMRLLHQEAKQTRIKIVSSKGGESVFEEQYSAIIYSLKNSSLFTIQYCRDNIIPSLLKDEEEKDDTRANTEYNIFSDSLIDNEKNEKEDEPPRSDVILYITIYSVSSENLFHNSMRDQSSTMGDTVLKKGSTNAFFQGNGKVHASQKLIVSGHTKLSRFRDKIYCILETIKSIERTNGWDPPGVSEEKDFVYTKSCKKTSSFLFIEDTFYVDDQGDGEEHSHDISEWIKMRSLVHNSRYNIETLSECKKTTLKKQRTSNNDKVSSYSPDCFRMFNPHPSKQKGIEIETRPMRDSRFIDLKVKIDYPYLFYHGGGCEHVFVVKRIESHLRPLHLDNNTWPEYPIQTFGMKYRRRKCRFCDIYSANYVVFNDIYAPENPCHFCKICYRKFHYDAEGRLVYSGFTTFRYIHE